MTIRKHYDAVIIGTALGGLISGALLAKRGLEVLVLNQEQIPWSMAFREFAIERENLSGRGFKRHLFEKIFEELGIEPHERLYFERSHPIFQVILPKQRLDISANREQLFAEYNREFPQAMPGILKFYEHLDRTHNSLKPLSSENTKEGLRSLFAQLQLPEAFQTSIVAQISFLSHIHTQNPTLTQAAQVLGGSHRKDYYFKGDAIKLAHLFYNRIQEAGGDIRDDAYVEHLYKDKGTITGAKLSSYEGVVSAKTYIGNFDIHRLYDLLEPFSKPRPLRKKLETLLPSFAKCGFYLAVHENVLPVGMQDNVVFIPKERELLFEDNLIFMHIYPREKSSPIRMIYVRFLVAYPNFPDTSFHEFQRKVQDVTQKILSHMSGLIPFLQQHLISIFPDSSKESEIFPFRHKGLESSPYLQGVYTLGGKDKHLQSGFQNTTPFRNLFLTGPEIFPALGFEGETISSLATADLAYQQFSHK